MIPRTPAVAIKPHSDRVGIGVVIIGGGGVQSIDGAHMYGGLWETSMPVI